MALKIKTSHSLKWAQKQLLNWFLFKRTENLYVSLEGSRHSYDDVVVWSLHCVLGLPWVWPWEGCRPRKLASVLIHSSLGAWSQLWRLLADSSLSWLLFVFLTVVTSDHDQWHHDHLRANPPRHPGDRWAVPGNPGPRRRLPTVHQCRPGGEN